jgi:hypothetical protein
MPLRLTIAIAAACLIPATLTLARAGDLPAPSSTELGRADWSVKASPNLAQKPPNKKTIEAFVATVDNSSAATLTESGMALCFAEFADLRHDGTLSLIVGLKIVGRAPPFDACEAYIVDKTPAEFEMLDGGGEAIGAEWNVLLHSTNEIKPALVLNSFLATAKNYCSAEWPAIYAWTGSNYANVRDQNKDFYRRRLDQLSTTIAELWPGDRVDGHEFKDKECLIAEAAAIRRFLGDSPDAGLDQAARLAHSYDPRERQFAAFLLDRIRTPATRPYLEALAKDSSENVSGSASHMFLPPLAIDAFRPVNEIFLN